MSIQYLSADSAPAGSDGLPLPFGTLTFWAEGSNELATVYTSSALTTPLTNPVVADGSGVFPEVWLAPTTRYRVKLEDADGRLVYDCQAYRPYQTDSAFLYLDAQIRSLVGGVPVSGAELSFEDASGNPVASYADAACTVPQTRPVVSDAAGLFPAIYLATAVEGYPPVPPVLGVAQAAAADPVVLTWTAASRGTSGPTGYRVYVSVNGGAFSLLTTAGAVLTYDDETIYEDGTDLLYYVSAVFAELDSLDSNQDGIAYQYELIYGNPGVVRLVYSASASAQSFVVPDGVTQARVWMVGPGGPGGKAAGGVPRGGGGGGGAGEVKALGTIPVAGTIAISVAVASVSPASTTFGVHTAIAGGSGAGYTTSRDGASGGGGACRGQVPLTNPAVLLAAGSSTVGQGAGASAIANSGNPSEVGLGYGGGGGGAGGNAPALSWGNAPDGGQGIYLGADVGTDIGDAGWFGGGGGGGTSEWSLAPRGSGGQGGGGDGGPVIKGDGDAGMADTGGGGGGESGGGSFETNASGLGGTGCVIVLYRVGY